MPAPMAGNANSGKRQEKLWRDALHLAVNAPGPEGKKKLRHIAETVVRLAMGGDMAAVKEIGDRLDGRPHQTVDTTVQHVEEGESFPRASSYVEWAERHGGSIATLGTSTGSSGKSH